MTTDLTMLALACLLAFIQMLLYAVPGVRQMGVSYALGPRDDGVTITGVAGRLKRAYLNHLETLPIFAVAVLVAHVAGEADAATALASQIYLVARIAYVPAYASGIPWGRSIAWGIATSAIVFILIKALT